ncbi:MAG: DUF1616 domain-containing protein [Dehalococcoidia bacterium]|nr:DUF1616 domain-containing protein [Dehalococcoidia bacterium]
MKARRDNDLWLIDILTILLIVIIALCPSTIARIILGLPFVLFFTGYTLMAALFPKKESLGGVERVALSFGLSIAVVPLIGLILNYTPWGIRLYPILISLAVFILATSGVAWYRRGKLAPEERFRVPFDIRLPSWRGQSTPDKVLSVVLAVVIAGAIGALGYVIAAPKVGEKFTEFYILGPEGKAEHYPEELKVGEEGRVIVGIVNHEQEQASYKVEVWIDGEKAKLRIGGEDRDEIMVELENEEEWREEVSFVPQKAGEKQKVEFVLYKGGEPYFEQPPYLWIDVEEG